MIHGLGYAPQLPGHTEGRERSVGTGKELLPAKEALNSNMTAPMPLLSAAKFAGLSLLQ